MQAMGEALDAAMEADDEDKAEALPEEGDRLDERFRRWKMPCWITATTSKPQPVPSSRSDWQGQIVVHRGLLREAEAKTLRTLEQLRQGFGSDAEARSDDTGEEPDTVPKTTAISDKLAQQLSAHRTAARQIEVARHLQVALAALVHGIVQTVLQGSYYSHDLRLGVSLKVQNRLESIALGIPDSPAAVALRELQQVAGDGLPQDSA